MHQCLRDQRDKLTENCRREELKLNIIQSRDIRLRPKLNKLCSEEIAVFCKDVKPGVLMPYLMYLRSKSMKHASGHALWPLLRFPGFEKH